MTVSVFTGPVYWTTDLGQFEAAGFSGEKGADGKPYRLVLVRRQTGGRWREFEQVKLDRAANPDVAFDCWRYRLTGYRITAEDRTRPTWLPVAASCGHHYFPAPEGVGEVLLIDGRRVCAPCSDELDRAAMRNPHPRAGRFEFQLEPIGPSPLQMRVTTPLGGLIGTATVKNTSTGGNPGGALWTRHHYEMRDVFGHVWEGTGGATSTRVKFKRVTPG